MSQMVIRRGRIILKDRILAGGSILIGGGKIRKVGKVSEPLGAVVVDAKGLFVAPGFIDTHIHGDPEAVLPQEIKYGTTSIVAAISCASPAKISRTINSIKRYLKNGKFKGSVLGIRLEGPYISKVRAGAQDRRYIQPPSVEGLIKIMSECDGLLKIMTVAPEVKGAHRIIKILKRDGVIASIGHTDAGRRACMKAVDAGATHATHLFNGMRRPAGDDDAAAHVCIEDKRVTVEIIVDMVHVKPKMLRLALSGKDKKNLILITDSVKAEMSVSDAADGVYRLKNGTIAGSSLTMIGAVKNAVRCCGSGLSDAVRYATANPARLLGIDKDKGMIAKAKDADIVIFDKDFDVKMTIARGKILYRKRGF